MLRAVSRQVSLAVAQGALTLAVSNAALGAAPRTEEPSEAPKPKLVTPASSPGGFVALSLGAAGLTESKTTFRELGTDGGEGQGDGGFTFDLSYQRALHPLLALRAFVHGAAWSTQLSDANGDGDRAVYDFGAAPALTWPVSSGRNGVSFMLVAPISFSLSQAPASAPRDVVREQMSLGTGYRYGLGVGMLTRFSRHLGMLFQAELARQRVSHERTYSWSDGTGGEVTQGVDFRLAWLGASIGLVVMP
jgi:hypothetical protein